MRTHTYAYNNSFSIPDIPFCPSNSRARAAACKRWICSVPADPLIECAWKRICCVQYNHQAKQHIAYTYTCMLTFAFASEMSVSRLAICSLHSFPKSVINSMRNGSSSHWQVHNGQLNHNKAFTQVRLPMSLLLPSPLLENSVSRRLP